MESFREKRKKKEKSEKKDERDISFTLHFFWQKE